MSLVESWVGEAASQSPVQAVLEVVYRIVTPPFLQPHERAHSASLALAALNTVERMAQTFVWFLVIGMVIYALSTRRARGASLSRFSYPRAIGEPGEGFSFLRGLKYLLPVGLYRHSSFRVDMFWLPFSIILSFFGLLGLTAGAGIVQGWLQQHLGHSPLAIPDGGLAIVAQVLIILVARDFMHFIWHFQGHSLPFFWEFHKGHHSAEVLHPFHVRTHPVDMFIRNSYIGLGGGLMGGTLIYLLGMSFSPTTAAWIGGLGAFFEMVQIPEHSHVRLSFGKTLDRVFYAPYMHHFHHGASPEHFNVNLGITGGLVLWDRLFGTLYHPKPGEQVVWGASLEELGENNPHRTVWGFFSTPFVGAFQILRRRDRGDVSQPADNATQPVSASSQSSRAA